MLGQGIGYLSKPGISTPMNAHTNGTYLGGGMIGDKWGIRRPFEVAFFSFLLSTFYVRTALPYIAAGSLPSDSKPNPKGPAEFFAPLRVLSPQKVLLCSGAVKKHYGVLFLCAGVFLGVVGSITTP